MTTNSVSNLKSRLRVVPIDVWSTREKLCLASSVLKSGDQNWSSVSRPLRSFGEPNRPNDWFHQKYCAIQYQDLLEKIETETPKRKRSERGEETPQTVIVKNLTKQRLEELREITKTETQMILKLKQDLDLMKNNKMNEKRFQDISNDIKEKERKAAEEEVKHKKWLEERDVKIAQMSRKGSLQARQKATTPALVSTPVTQTISTNPSVTETAVKSPINEPLKVEIDSENTSQKPTQTQTPENKLTLTLTSPTSSPLLTSLLQSPTPSTQTLQSPNKTGLSVDPFTRQKPSTPTTPITRRPPIHPMPELVTEVVKVADKSEPNVGKESETKPVVSTDTTHQIAVKSSLDSQIISSSKPKTTVIEVKANETEIQEKRDSIQKIDISDKTKTSDKNEVEIEVIEPQIKTNESINISGNSEKVTKTDENSDRLLRNKNKIEESMSSGKELNERRDDIKETDKSVEKRAEESIETISVKQETIELTAEEVEPQKETDSIVVKEEPSDSTSVTAVEESNARTPSTRANKRLRKTPLTITPTAMRRSRRVALKDTKIPNDDSTEVSDQSAANTPQAVKKRGSVDDTTETSMSEESMDSKIMPTTASIDTVPNSPASVRTEDMDNSKEYQKWKRAVMVNWRLISAHKNASLFSHPVTETEAKGYEDIVLRPMDLNTIKKRVETGIIRTTDEYQRDLMLMFQNAIMFNSVNHDVHQMAVDMQKDTIGNIQAFIETQKNDNQTTNESKLRARERRSNVSTISPLITESEISGRRKSRGASTDTDSNASGLNKSVTKKKKT